MGTSISQRLQREWSILRNGPIPEGLKSNSSKAFWWTCNYDHEWKAPVYSRTSGNNCSVCSRRKFWRGVTDLATNLPEWEAIWDYETNYPKTPDQIYWKSNKKYTYKCLLGHRWQDLPNKRRKIPICQFCRQDKYAKVLVGENDLITFCETNGIKKLLKEWDFKENIRHPQSYLYRSTSKVFWICEKDSSHTWGESIRNRAIIGYGCPFCSGQRLIVGENDLRSQDPALALLWHPTKNLPLLSHQVAKAAGIEIWWKCTKNHEWVRPPNIQRKRDGCPECTPWGTSKMEREIFNRLEKLSYSLSRRTLLIKWGDKTKIRPDMIVNDKIIIEYDGHYYHRDTTQEDRLKTESLINAGFKVIRIRDGKLLDPLFSHKNNYYEVIIDEIKDDLEKTIKTLVELLNQIV